MATAAMRITCLAMIDSSMRGRGRSRAARRRQTVYSGMPRIAVFCGSRAGIDPAYAAAAAALGGALAERGCELVYGGAHVGLMGIAADAVLAGGGRVTGVIPTAMVERELAHRGITDLRIVGSMHERKALMASLADAFLVLPGGMGTLDELCEILTWAQLGLHGKPVGLLDVRDYWRGFLAFLDTAVHEGFLRDADRLRLHHQHDVGALLDALLAAALEPA
jgi:uncharacterized protein (TIGR00730 family)